MARITVEDCLQKVSNRFMLVHLAAKRVIQLRKGAKPLVEAPKNREVVLALREIAAGKVDFTQVQQFEQEQVAAESTFTPLPTPEGGQQDDEEKSAAEEPAADSASPAEESTDEAADKTAAEAASEDRAKDSSTE
ncbi:MAG: DNA-directed RNA polymerase subunit omega [Deltaproteobacteria bacterium]|nr:DNA-directed RNA polymerase subunit omega [Deltaproteobacteria bacterium]MBW2072650.1 DNA-directed RNA polymerase subunit omega [Deltaproteobacteria bacterium]